VTDNANHHAGNMTKTSLTIHEDSNTPWNRRDLGQAAKNHMEDREHASTRQQHAGMNSRVRMMTCKIKKEITMSQTWMTIEGMGATTGSRKNRVQA
jgi:hypothetical protein